ncbi:hypothetical protein [Desulfovibrio sp. 86]|uniref:Uncharacterized protein n=1 Tax=uncultured Desulfovibrio sp. TaxID=167968 RepID=A0A212L572_9BACT|nr:hypothetical protein [Desulfovibrio sp. 86]SCM72724.1 membrane hypothetical protein [uncultured Desulfovibrio sp.]VZH33701.1 conserved membrane protein of unknown function [Desulfovibrio sp. 86]
MPAKRKPVAISTMALMSVGTVVSLNALPMMAAEGLSRIHRHVLYSGLGFLGVAFAFLVEFFHRTTCPSATPPSVGLVAGGLCTFLAMPLLVHAFKNLDGSSRRKQKTAFNPMATMENRA